MTCYGFKWNDNYYSYTRLAFESRSSPKIFDCCSSLICWILQKSYGIRNVLLLFYDCLATYPPPSVYDANITMLIMLAVVESLNVPLAKHTIVGPVTSIEYVAIILDTYNMLAKRPEDKLCRIKYVLFSFLNRRTCTKHEMPCLLGHLNFAMIAIPMCRSFTSCPLNMAHSVKELHHHVSITAGCRHDLDMWFRYLEQWNGISFFIDDNCLKASDYDLFTDASSRCGLGGYFQNRWFQGVWLDEVKLGTDDSCMAYTELYPIVITSRRLCPTALPTTCIFPPHSEILWNLIML